MKKFTRRAKLFVVFVVLFLVSCTKQASETGKQSNLESTTTAQLLKPDVGARLINDAYIVVFNDYLSSVDAEVDQLKVKHSIKDKYRFKHAIKGFSAVLPQAVVDALRINPNVKYIEQDQEVRIVTTQSGATWGIDRTDQRDLPLNTNYDYNSEGSAIDAYIFDTGIKLDHVDFGGRAVAGYDAFGGTTYDGNGHGTHVAGTVGGTAYGIAKSVRLVAVRVLDNNGSGSLSSVIAGLDWAVSNHTTRPAVGNMSLGGGASQSLDDAAKRAIADGIVLCVAAGNSSVDASTASPARVSAAITVGATDINDRFATFSNYGTIVDILAPGVSIKSDWHTSTTATNTISGTSMATPHVAGAAALYIEANPGSTPAQVESGLKANATSNKITGLPSGTSNLLLYSLSGTPPAPTIPLAPTQRLPAEGSTAIPTNTTLSWNASTGAQSYAVQISTDINFTTGVIETNGITSTSINVSLVENTIYYWRVNAKNNAGISEWSTIWRFKTVDPSFIPPAPVLTSPTNGATNVGIPAALSWSASSGATRYRVQVSTNATFTAIAYDNSVTGTSASVPGLLRRTTYYWRITASNSEGSSTSITWRFTTAKR